MQEEKGTTEDEMVGWHHRIDEHEFQQAPGVGDGQESLACCSPWGRKESNTTEQHYQLTDGSILVFSQEKMSALSTTLSSVQLSSVAQSCPTLCDPMDCSTPGLPVHRQLLEFTQTHVH